MGNHFTSYAKNVSISLDPGTPGAVFNGRYFAGQKLTGHVNIVADRTFDKDASTISVVFQGIEKTKVRYTRTHTTGVGDKKRTRTTTHYAHGKRNICTQQVTLDIGKSPTFATDGSYAVPFELTIPGTLPSSMSCGNNNSYARIEYQLGVRMNDLFMEPRKWISIKLYANTLEREPAPAFAKPHTVPIFTCWCFKKGHITFGAKVEDVLVREGQPVTLSLGCQNDSAVPVDCVHAQIKQIVQWKAKGHYKTKEETLATVHLNQTESMKERNIESIRAIESRNKDATVRRALYDEWNRQIYQEITRGTNKSSIKIPAGAQHTWAGSLITVTHTLTLTIHTPSGSTNPSTRFHLRIVPPVSTPTSTSSHPMPSAPPMVEAIAYPVGWDASHVQKIGDVASDNVAIQYGGPATASEEDIPLVSVTPTAPRNISFEGLLMEISDSFNVQGTIRDLMKDPQWNQGVFASMSPVEFGRVFVVVDNVFDQPEVAEILARANVGFGCGHVVSMLANATSYARIGCVQKTIRYCKDFSKNKNSILKALTDWERVCTERDFDELS